MVGLLRSIRSWTEQTLGEAGPDFTPGTIRLEGASVPEPATLAALGLGLAGVQRRRRHRHSNISRDGIHS